MHSQCFHKIAIAGWWHTHEYTTLSKHSAGHVQIVVGATNVHSAVGADGGGGVKLRACRYPEFPYQDTVVSA